MPADPAERMAAIAAHLEATETLPLDPRANRWLGEAHAIAADAVGADETVIRDRAADLRRLLDEVDETGHPDGDAHLEAATSLLTALEADSE